MGSKLPAKGNVHEVVAEVAPDATVLFADGDPVVLAHARALLAGTERAAVVQCDPMHPDAITSDPHVRALIDFGRPVGLVLDRVLHFVDDTAEAAKAVARLHDALSPGSHVVFTHITRDPQPESSGEVGRLFKPTRGHFWGRRRAEIQEIVSSFDLVEPGLTFTSLWRPDRPGGGRRAPRAHLHPGRCRPPRLTAVRTAGAAGRARARRTCRAPRAAPVPGAARRAPPRRWRRAPSPGGCGR
ncbi:SAM-dependent methyltransferase [Actinomadura madurae]|uniref:SAM-dependent methyltransferase n=1 Tax=Actinomadura madurae TaxID=1993 RepID=UPI0020D1FA53|nr:SAM-dependent methyltransferase [Actinomadura madurae]